MKLQERHFYLKNYETVQVAIIYLISQISKYFIVFIRIF